MKLHIKKRFNLLEEMRGRLVSTTLELRSGNRMSYVGNVLITTSDTGVKAHDISGSNNKHLDIMKLHIKKRFNLLEEMRGRLVSTTLELRSGNRMSYVGS
ncbi:Hypothetical protein SMAX5B_003166 [Scophthalmus maximus]|uniref:Uncharacterized protein n=1 Tax=Scophthalmus maximus TaxID=52904 RepID=A0A2U9CX84_SCOMX|nr:Hypothetical protein SMAX5B_003166 [Scophthalmus maximus]